MAALLEERQRGAIVVLHAWLEERHSVQLASTKTDSQSHLEIWLIRNLYERLESDGSVTENSERGTTFLLGVGQEADRTLLVAAGARSRSSS